MNNERSRRMKRFTFALLTKESLWLWTSHQHQNILRLLDVPECLIILQRNLCNEPEATVRTEFRETVVWHYRVREIRTHNCLTCTMNIFIRLIDRIRRHDNWNINCEIFFLTNRYTDDAFLLENRLRRVNYKSPTWKWRQSELVLRWLWLMTTSLFWEFTFDNGTQ